MAQCCVCFLYGSWESLDSLKILPRGTPTFPTPGQAIPTRFVLLCFVVCVVLSRDKLSSIVVVYVFPIFV